MCESTSLLTVFSADLFTCHRRTILGPAERVKAFNRADFAGFVSEHYGPDQMILSAAGAVDHDQIVKLAETLFADAKRSSAATAQPALWRGAERREVKALEQAHFALGFEAPGFHDPDLYTAQVYTTALGGGMSSRLFQKIREEREKTTEVHDEPSLSFSADDDADVSHDTQVADEGPSEVLILYVLLPEGQEINGAMLLPSLLTLGFKYGEMNIFHRHQDSAGSGAVLFSLANMFNPGTFDLENMDKLATRGVSLFMTLPGPGEPLQNFNLMHNAAKKLAEEFGGQVLDGQRSVLTVQTVRHYVDKIREFQRQQLIHG